jgi:hypothetical protein
MISGVVAEELLDPFGIAPDVLPPNPDFDYPAPSDDVVYPFSLYVPGYLLLDDAFDDGDTFYLTIVSDGSRILLPALVVDVDAFNVFASQIVRVLAPAPYAPGDLIYAPTVIDKVLGPPLVIDDDLFGGTRKITQGKANINQTFPIDTVYSDDVVYSVIVEQAGRVFVGGAEGAVASRLGIIVVDETTPYASALPGLFLDAGAALSAPPLGYLTPSLLVSDDAIPAADMLGGLQPAGTAGDDLVYAASLTAARLLPSALPSSDAIFAAALVAQLSPASVLDADVFIGPALATPGLMGLVVDADSFPAPRVGFAPMLPSRVQDADTFFVPVAGELLPLQPFDAVVDFQDTFYAPTILAQQKLTPTIWIDVDQIMPVPSVATDQVGHPGLVVDSDTVYAPAASSTASMLPALFDDTDTIFATITLSTIGAQADPVVDVDAVYAAGVTFADYPLPSLHVDADGFYAPAVQPGAATVSPSALSDVDGFYVQTVAAVSTATPALVMDADSISAVGISSVAVAGLVTDTDVFLAPKIALSGRQAAIASQLGVVYVSESTSNETDVAGVMLGEGG